MVVVNNLTNISTMVTTNYKKIIQKITLVNIDNSSSVMANNRILPNMANLTKKLFSTSAAYKNIK